MKAIFCLLFTLFLSCSDSDDIENGTSFYWDQTGCADPWGTGANDSNSDTGTALKAYLIGKGISAVDVVGFENNIEEGDNICYACHCITGIRIYIEVPGSEETKMEELGFKRK